MTGEVMMVVMMMMEVTTRQVLRAIGSRRLHAREHEPGENEEDERELHNSGKSSQEPARVSSLRKLLVRRRP
jgi:hypothetical protein